MSIYLQFLDKYSSNILNGLIFTIMLDLISQFLLFEPVMIYLLSFQVLGVNYLYQASLSVGQMIKLYIKQVILQLSRSKYWMILLAIRILIIVDMQCIFPLRCVEREATVHIYPVYFHILRGTTLIGMFRLFPFELGSSLLQSLKIILASLIQLFTSLLHLV